MSIRLSVPLGSRSYEIVIGCGLASALQELMDGLKPTAVAVITDTNVAAHHGALAESLGGQVITVPAGEQCKTLAEFEELLKALLHLDRNSLIVALGGGAVGDLAGFAAATLYRGVRWICVPASLLAMVDSSVGGKTGINLGGAKNQLGAFHQPVGVFCDLDLLATLPEREYVSGLAEVVKTAAIGDAALLEVLDKNADSLLQRDAETLAAVVAACVRYKAGVVADDENESTGRRAVLNFGHTLGHALEALFPGRYLHGEAVAVGMCAALRVSVARAGLSLDEAQRVEHLLLRFGLPTTVPTDADATALAELILADKKRAGGQVRFVALQAVASPMLLDCAIDAEFMDTLTGRQ